MYRKNLQGDVTHIYTVDGEQVGHYVYDAWGNMRILQDRDGIATLNPFRYRSYYFDEETNLYYLQTRYYDPEVGRFINADALEYIDPETIGGLNLYSYCGNNPIINIDPQGAFWFTALTTLIGAVIGAAASIGTAIINHEEITWKKVVCGTVSGAVTGFVLGISKGTAIAAASYAAVAAESLVSEVWDYAAGDKELTWNNVGDSLLHIASDTLLNGTINYISNKTAASLGPIKTNSGWIVPKKFVSYFTKSYGQKMIMQTVVSGIIGVGLFVAKKKIEDLYQNIIYVLNL